MVKFSELVNMVIFSSDEDSNECNHSIDSIHNITKNVNSYYSINDWNNLNFTNIEMSSLGLLQIN